ncbi:unnamed protein product [Leptidea sinapis]|uniref:Uncharacterized protein n=1 Tax=Leptidea sinapis TaxID=189913 RepID=A0A5E4PLQ4_9NEOP|nr:unnamed protein product [Leptidea sinapis]
MLRVLVGIASGVKVLRRLAERGPLEARKTRSNLRYIPTSNDPRKNALRAEALLTCFWGTGYVVTWVKHGVDYADIKFSKPKANRILEAHELPENQMSPDNRRIEQMWCPYLIPKKKIW